MGTKVEEFCSLKMTKWHARVILEAMEKHGFSDPVASDLAVEIASILKPHFVFGPEVQYELPMSFTGLPLPELEIQS